MICLGETDTNSVKKVSVFTFCNVFLLHLLRVRVVRVVKVVKGIITSLCSLGVKADSFDYGMRSKNVLALTSLTPLTPLTTKPIGW